MKQIDWTKWSAIAEILSATAILVTLIYLAVQTQQNTAAVQASVRQAMLAEDREYLAFVTQNPELNLLFLRDIAALTDLEKFQLHGIMSQMIRIRENQYLQFRNGAIDPETFASFSNTTVRILSLRIPRIWWESNSQALDQDFVDYVNERLEGVPIVEMTVAEFTGLP